MEELIRLLTRIADALENQNTIAQALMKRDTAWRTEDTRCTERQLKEQFAFIATQNALQRRAMQPQTFTLSELRGTRPLDPPLFPGSTTDLDNPLEQEEDL